MPEQPEWIPCPQCNGWIGADELFCPECGAARPAAATSTTRRRWPLIVAGGAALLLTAFAFVAVMVLITSPARPPAAAAASPTPSATPIPATPRPTATPILPSATAAPSATPAPATPVATPVPPTPTVAPTPTPAPLVIAGLEPHDAARILETLNVRTKPGVGFPLISARSPSDGSIVDDEVQVAAGTYVWIENGPVLNDGYAWYRVYPISYDQYAPFWDGRGWIAAGAGSVAWLVEDSPPPAPSQGDGHHQGGYHTVHLAGMGPAVSDSFFGAQPSVEWDATDADAGPCDLVARLVDVDTGEVFTVIEETVGSAPETGWWGGGAAQGTYRLEVDSTCSWSILVNVWES